MGDLRIAHKLRRSAPHAWCADETEMWPRYSATWHGVTCRQCLMQGGKCYWCAGDPCTCRICPRCSTLWKGSPCGRCSYPGERRLKETERLAMRALACPQCKACPQCGGADVRYRWSEPCQQCGSLTQRESCSECDWKIPEKGRET